MDRIPLQTLPAFRLTARHGSVRAAAEELSLTPSAVSQQIRLLEQQLGMALFERRGRALALNTAGRALLRAVEPALDGLGQGVRAAQAATAGVAQHLRLSVLPSLALRWLLPRIGHWRERHPDITVEVHTSPRLADLGRDGVHAGLRLGHGRWRGLQAELISDRSLIPVAAPQRAARLRQGDPAALAAQPLLGDPEMWAAFFAQCGQPGAVRPAADFNDAGLMLQAAEQDLGIALARELLVVDALRAGRLVRISPVEIGDPDSSGFWLAYPPDLAEWPPMSAFRLWLREQAAASVV